MPSGPALPTLPSGPAGPSGPGGPGGAICIFWEEQEVIVVISRFLGVSMGLGGSVGGRDNQSG